MSPDMNGFGLRVVIHLALLRLEDPSTVCAFSCG